MQNREFRFSLEMVIVFLFLASISFSQQYAEVVLENAASYTSLQKQLGPELQMFATADRFIITDLYNYRILFYKRGATLNDNQFLKSVGTHSLTGDGVPFTPGTAERLTSQFSVALWRDTLFVANTNNSEILRFSTDGNYLGRSAARMELLTADADHLIGVSSDSMYLYSPQTRLFTSVRKTPQSVKAGNRLADPTIKIGRGLLGVRKDTTLALYNLEGYLQGASLQPLFTVHASAIPAFAILSDRVAWAQGYTPKFASVDFNGQNKQSGTMTVFEEIWNYSDGVLFLSNYGTAAIYDNAMNPVTVLYRSSFYYLLTLLGADATNLYFYDGSVGGIAVVEQDLAHHRLLYNPDKKIWCSAWLAKMRQSSAGLFFLDTFPPDSRIYKLNVDSLTKRTILLPESRGFDLVGDSLYVLVQDKVFRYDSNGTAHGSVMLNGVNATAKVLFAANLNDFFISDGATIVRYGHDGARKTSFPIPLNTRGFMWADDENLYVNMPARVISIATGLSELFAPGLNDYDGCFNGNRYWYLSGTNTYAYVDRSGKTGIVGPASQPAAFTLGQNYPNPFNPTTTIFFTLQHSGPARLVLYDALGREVAVLVDGVMTAGEHNVQLNARDLGTGVYFYRLESGSSMAVKKLLVLR